MPFAVTEKANEDTKIDGLQCICKHTAI